MTALYLQPYAAPAPRLEQMLPGCLVAGALAARRSQLAPGSYGCSRMLTCEVSKNGAACTRAAQSKQSRNVNRCCLAGWLQELRLRADVVVRGPKIEDALFFFVDAVVVHCQVGGFGGSFACWFACLLVCLF